MTMTHDISVTKKKILFVSQYKDYATWPELSSQAQSWEKILTNFKKKKI